MSAQNPKRTAEDLSDSDWEYEYDEVETEVCIYLNRRVVRVWLTLQEFLRHP